MRIRTSIERYCRILESYEHRHRVSVKQNGKLTELINTNSDLLLNLINDILDLSRIESGRMSFSFQQYSLNELISTIYQTFQVLMPENVELRMQIPEKSISIPTDKLRLTQVITNFLATLSNSRKRDIY